MKRSCIVFPFLTLGLATLVPSLHGASPPNEFGKIPSEYSSVPIREGEHNSTRKGKRSIKWKSFGKFAGSDLVNRFDLWFTAKLEYRTDSSNVAVLELDSLGVQARYDSIRLRFDPDQSDATKVLILKKGVPVTADANGWFTIEPRYIRCCPTDPKLEYFVKFETGHPNQNGKVALECYVDLPHPTDGKPVPPGQYPHPEEANDGFPPPGSPGDLD